VKVGDLVLTPRYGTWYIIVGKREDLSCSHGGQVFDIISTDLTYRQVLNERYLEVISESR
jgi:hypothetical protein